MTHSLGTRLYTCSACMRNTNKASQQNTHCCTKTPEANKEEKKKKKKKKQNSLNPLILRTSSFVSRIIKASAITPVLILAMSCCYLGLLQDQGVSAPASVPSTGPAAKSTTKWLCGRKQRKEGHRKTPGGLQGGRVTVRQRAARACRVLLIRADSLIWESVSEKKKKKNNFKLISEQLKSGTAQHRK